MKQVQHPGRRLVSDTCGEPPLLYILLFLVVAVVVATLPEILRGLGVGTGEKFEAVQQTCLLTLFVAVWVYAELAGRVGPFREMWLHRGDRGLQDTWVLARANVCRRLASGFRSILAEIATLLILLVPAGAGWYLASRVGVDCRLGACAGVAALPLLLVSLILVSELRGFHVSKRWLVEVTTFQEIEAQLPDNHPPFTAEWKAFKAEMVEGDELWIWRTSPESRKQRRGRSGYVVVRDGEPIEHFIITVMT